MNGLFVHDEMRANGSVHNRVLRASLTANLALLRPHLQSKIASSIAGEMASSTIGAQGSKRHPSNKISTSHQSGCIRIQAFSMATRVVVAINRHTFFGAHSGRCSSHFDRADATSFNSCRSRFSGCRFEVPKRRFRRKRDITLLTSHASEVPTHPTGCAAANTDKE